MIVEGKKIYFIVEHEFEKIALALLEKHDLLILDPGAAYYGYDRGVSWNYHIQFGKENTHWEKLEKLLNIKYIKAKGPKGCHVFDFNTESARLAFQLKYGDIISG